MLCQTVFTASSSSGGRRSSANLKSCMASASQLPMADAWSLPSFERDAITPRRLWSRLNPTPVPISCVQSSQKTINATKHKIQYAFWILKSHCSQKLSQTSRQLHWRKKCWNICRIDTSCCSLDILSHVCSGAKILRESSSDVSRVHTALLFKARCFSKILFMRGSDWHRDTRQIKIQQITAAKLLFIFGSLSWQLPWSLQTIFINSSWASFLAQTFDKKGESSDKVAYPSHGKSSLSG